MIRVAILAHGRARRQSLSEMLEEDGRFEVIAWQGLAQSQADVVLAVDVLTAAMPEDGPPLVALGSGTELAPFNSILRATLPGNASDSEIVAALIAAANNLTVLTASQARRLLRFASADEEPDLLVEALTPREMEVLQMMGAGLGNKEIAASLGMSTHTAKFHVAQIMAKLDAASRTEAVSIGIRRGFIPI